MLERNDVDGESERNLERRSRLVRTRRGVIGSSRSEVELHLLEGDALDDLKFALSRQDGGDLQARYGIVQPGDITGTSVSADDVHIGIDSVDEVGEDTRDSRQTRIGILLNQTASQRQLEGCCAEC